MVRDVGLRERICDRIVLLQQAVGGPIAVFARAVGATPQQFGNWKNYWGVPSHEVLRNACEQYRVTADYFYFNIIVGVPEPMQSTLHGLIRGVGGLNGEQVAGAAKLGQNGPC